MKCKTCGGTGDYYSLLNSNWIACYDCKGSGVVAELSPLEKRLAEDKVYQDLKKKSERLAEARSALPIGTSRAKVTTANAKWKRVAEARQQREREILAELEKEGAA